MVTDAPTPEHIPADVRTVAVVQTTIPDYRVRFFEDLGSRLGSRLVLLSGRTDWYPGLVASDVPHVEVTNVFLVRRQLLWQRGALRHLLSADTAVVSLNPRVVSSWIALVGRRLARRRTVLWGHAWPRRGQASWTDRLRSVMRRLGGTLVVYTEAEARDLRRASPAIDVLAAPNALYRRSELGHVPAARPAATDIICVGRLTDSKRPDLLLAAFKAATDALPPDTRLVFVGDGPRRGDVEASARSAGLMERVVFMGHVSSIEELRRVYARAIASVAPGEVGLSLVQSLGFGVPMLLAHDEAHGPEIEVAVAGVNALFFERGSTSGLAAAIVEVVGNRDAWLSRRARIAAPIRERHAIENMVDAFVRALHLEASTLRGGPPEPAVASEVPK